MKKYCQSAPRKGKRRPAPQPAPQPMQWLFVTMIVALLIISAILIAIGFIVMNLATGELVIIPGTTGIEVYWVE